MLTAREQYRLASSLERAKFLIESYRQHDSYDMYCELTSYSDLDEWNRDDIEDHIIEEWDREAEAVEKARAFVAQWQAWVEQRFIDAVHKIPRRSWHEHGTIKFQVFDDLTHGSIRGGYYHEMDHRRSQITEALEARAKCGSWAQVHRWHQEGVEKRKRGTGIEIYGNAERIRQAMLDLYDVTR